MADFISQFKKSLETGFIDKDIGSEFLYQPKLLVNSKNPRKKILSSLLWELQTCESFFISVAFLTTGGVATIINVLHELEQKGVQGKIVVSQYLNFTQPEALRRLLQFENIELKIATNVDAHSKGYLFRKKDHFSLIVGSSNLTQNALASNKEWNLQVSAIEDSKIIHKVQQEFESDFNSATPVTSEFIHEYEKIYERKRITFSELVEEKIFKNSIEPNAMQTTALSNLANIRSEGKNKALIISATGTGKTFLAAFDAQSQQPKRLLFVVHRLNIAKKAMKTFEEVFSRQKSMGIYSGNKRELDKDFLFSTVQTISKLEHLKVFEPNHFDYIIIDESHRAGAQSYNNLIEYFSPRFLLGMTATPERTDGADIFRLFDHNIAYEIRLNDAMEEQMLCPFHYYGVSDLYIDEEVQDDVTLFNKLTSGERVKRIVGKSKFYGTDNGICRGLVFVSKVSEAHTLSKKFNDRGFRTVALSGSNSNEERALAIELLESENESKRLDYIFTVDIFNEGIDIPKVNQIIMLRPTESAIIFVQQLGRGLRKLDSKSYLTVIDFIGNHNNNYLIPIALYGDTSFNKDKLRKLLSDGSTDLPGVSTINFDRISKEKIFESIDSANMRLLKDLKKDYSLLKFRLGRYPLMMDFVDSNSRDPYHFVKYSKSYYDFIGKVDSDFEVDLGNSHSEILRLFSLEINNGKRIEESLILQDLLDSESLSIEGFKLSIKEEFNYNVSDETIESVLKNLNFEFVKKSKNIVTLENGRIRRHPNFTSLLQDINFTQFLRDSIQYSIYTFRKYYSKSSFTTGFILHNKYSRKDVCRVLNWDKDISSTVYGYRTNKGSTPCFVTYHKGDDIEGSIDYNDHFVSPSVFAWESRSNRRIESTEIQNVIQSERVLLFIKKADSEGTEFYYMGDVGIIPESIEQGEMEDTAQPVVHFKFKLHNPVPENLYSYITDANIDTTIPQLDIAPFEMSDTIEEEITPQQESQVFRIPLFDFYAAAGSFSDIQTAEDYSMIEVPEFYNKEGYFACKVIGESMNRRIPNGSICIFKHPVVGGRTGKILLVEYYNKQDTDTQSHFTIKTYSSSKVITEKGWKHEEIILKPNSYDASYGDIIISEEDIRDNNFNVVGEFVDILNK
jgi:superfamily II DNA or RNA helicase